MTTRADLLEAIARRDAIQAELDAAALDVSRKLYALKVEQGESDSSIGALLGLSRQRVSQLIARAEKETREAYQLEDAQAAYDRRVERTARAQINRGFRTGGYPCAVKACGRFKSRPSSVCDHCGDDPVSFNGDRAAYDREHGYA